jgi:hypothetical protein
MPEKRQLTPFRPDPKPFDEQSVRCEIVKVWGEHGAHTEVYDMLLNERDDLKRLIKQVKELLK